MGENTSTEDTASTPSAPKNQNLLNAKIKRVDKEIEIEQKKYDTLVKIMKLKQAELKERLVSGSLRHNLKVTDLDRKIKELSNKAKELAEQLATKAYMKEKVTEGYPGERLERLTAELKEVEETIVFLKEDLTAENKQYEQAV